MLGYLNSSDEHTGTLWEEYLSILTDPSHFLAELTFTLIDIALLSPLIFFVIRAIRTWVSHRISHEHAILDAEHQVEHHNDALVSAATTSTCTPTSNPPTLDSLQKEIEALRATIMQLKKAEEI
jgi:sterol desaturase/sphingolipid hydroxylase (fatty acid hydroxylase superfamily)